MAIRFPHQLPDAEDGLMSSINTTPLVDVMLVLLIIFLITIPVVNSSIAVTLPREGSHESQPQPDTIIVTVDAQGQAYWFDAPVTQAALADMLVRSGAQQPQPELDIRADARADYDAIGRVVYSAQQAGISRIGFLTEPPQ